MSDERAALLDALRRNSERFADLVASLTPEQAARRPPNLDWTCVEVAAHVLTVVNRTLGDMRRSSSPADTAVLNQTVLDELDERDTEKLARLIRERTALSIDTVLSQIPTDIEFDFHAGTKTTLVPGIAVVLGEFLVHGFDIARAVELEWRIEQEDAQLIFWNAGSVLHGWAKRDYKDGPTEVIEIHFADGSDPAYFTFGDGRFEIRRDAATEPAATTMVEPVAFMLAFPYRRVASDDPLVQDLVARFEPV